MKIRGGLQYLLLAGIFVLAAAGSAIGGSPPAITEQALYKFCSQTSCTDGGVPLSGLIMDSAGNLYGTTALGGIHNGGTVFKLTPSSTGWTETVLYAFCAQYPCADGAYPYAGVIMDGAGNLYGTTYSGGSHNNGTVFKLTPSSTGWTETVLYAFCAQTNCSDGANPDTGVIMDAAGNLYGTTVHGGNFCTSEGALGCGAVFQLTATTTGSTLSVSVIGSPGGKVTSSPAGIDCGATCSASFAAGTQVTLTASPATAWGLSSWGGACGGIGGCSVTMNANTSVSASFTTVFFAPQVPQPDAAALPPPVLSPLPLAPHAF